MANAQFLLVVAQAIPAATLRAIVEAAGRAQGFTPGPSTYAAGQSVAAREPGSSTTQAFVTFSTGPFINISLPVSPPPAAAVSNVPWSALRMNLLDGPPDTGTADARVSAIENVLNAVKASLPEARVSVTRPSHVISWDRNVPAAIVLEESSPSGSASGGAGGGGGWLLGLAAVAGLAFVARRATANGPKTGLSPTSYGRPKFAGLGGARPPKGTPTHTNLFVLHEWFSDNDEAPNRVPPTDAPHLRRLIAAGLITADRQALHLTAAGRAERDRLAAKEAARVTRYGPRQTTRRKPWLQGFAEGRQR